MVGQHSAGPGQTPLFAHLPPPQGPGVAAVEHTFGSLLTSSLLSLGGRGGAGCHLISEGAPGFQAAGEAAGPPSCISPSPSPHQKVKGKGQLKRKPRGRKAVFQAQVGAACGGGGTLRKSH